MYKITRADTSNKLMQKLAKNWIEEAKKEKLQYDPKNANLLRVIGISEENPQDKRYGIFIVSASRSNSAIAPYYAFVDVNFKLVGMAGEEIRVIWHHMSPKTAANTDRAIISEVYGSIIGFAVQEANKLKKNKKRVSIWLNLCFKKYQKHGAKL